MKRKLKRKSNIPNIKIIEREYSAREVQVVLRALASGTEKVGLALLNYYARTDLLAASGKTLKKGRRQYTYADVVLLVWLFKMKKQGLPVNRFRKGISYLRKNIPSLHENYSDFFLLTDGRQLYLKHRINEKYEIAEVLTGNQSGQYVWAFPIGNLIEEVDKTICTRLKKAA